MQSVNRAKTKFVNCDLTTNDDTYEKILARLKKTQCNYFLSSYFVKQIYYSDLINGSQTLLNFVMASEVGLAPLIHTVLWKHSQRRIVVLCEKCKTAEAFEIAAVSGFFEKMGAMGILRANIQLTDLIVAADRPASVLCCSWPSTLTAGLANSIDNVDPTTITFVNMVSASDYIHFHAETLARYVPYYDQKDNSHLVLSILRKHTLVSNSNLNNRNKTDRIIRAVNMLKEQKKQLLGRDTPAPTSPR